MTMANWYPIGNEKGYIGWDGNGVKRRGNILRERRWKEKKLVFLDRRLGMC
jgi:hypothetical protein